MVTKPIPVAPHADQLYDNVQLLALAKSILSIPLQRSLYSSKSASGVSWASGKMRPQVTALFASLHSRPWSLTRTLHSDNPMDIKGEIRGTATFTPCKQTKDTANTDTQETPDEQTLVYREEGEMPASVMGMAGLRWTKRYIWRLADNMSVWFAKADRDEADYLFHEFDFENQGQSGPTATATNPDTVVVTAPTPPVVANVRESSILVARGNHLCINDMYRTAYAFRVLEETGEVISWSSRHVVKGPKKDQDIVNIYQQV